MENPMISNWQMVGQFAYALALVVTTVLIHGGGLFGIARLLGIERNQKTRIRVDLVSFRGLALTVVLVLAIFVLHAIEIWVYASVYYWNGALPTFAQALYLSTLTYSTIGYTGADMSDVWLLVAAIEGINGIFLLGWSTAFIVLVTGRISRDGG